jgi:hypothetical protein
MAMRAANFVLSGLSQRQDLRKRLVASHAQIFICGHFRLLTKHSKTFYSEGQLSFGRRDSTKVVSAMAKLRPAGARTVSNVVIWRVPSSLARLC